MSVSLPAPPGKTLPSPAHDIVKFVTAAIHRHGMILTETNRHHFEQWVELVARFFLYDSTEPERDRTRKLIRRHHHHVWRNIEAVISFERLVRSTAGKDRQRVTDVDAAESALRQEWERLSAEVVPAKRRRRAAQLQTTNAHQTTSSHV